MKRRCPDCGWELPRFDCPHQGCNGVALHVSPQTRLRSHLIDLDMTLTGKSRGEAEHMARGQKPDPFGDNVYYLSDGGYSRVVLHWDGGVNLTSSSLDRVKEAWRHPDAVEIVAAISNLIKEGEERWAGSEGSSNGTASGAA